MFSKIRTAASAAMHKIGAGARSACAFAKNTAGALIIGGSVVGTTLVAAPTAEATPPTLPDLGVDVGGAITAAAGDLGVVFMTIITIGIVLCVAWIAWGWRKKIRG